MSLKSLRQVIVPLKQYQPQQQQQFQQLLTAWTEAVGAGVAANTRPVTIQRSVLQVATSSASWAQNLVFERRRLLETLNDRGGFGLTDIRFSTAEWHRDRATYPGLEEQTRLWQAHPSRLPASSSPLPRIEIEAGDPQRVFEHWAEQVRSRTRSLPHCPQCQSPTPPGELDRWQVCAVCATKHW